MNKPKTKALLHRNIKSESPCLILERGLQRGHAFPLPMPRGKLSLGRDPSCDIAFDPNVERMVSRHHAEVEVRADGVWIKDLGSANRTRLNDQLLQGEARLKDGDRLELGPDGPLILVRLPPPDDAPWTKAVPTDDAAHLPPLHPEPRPVPVVEAPAPVSSPVGRGVVGSAVGSAEGRGAAPAVNAAPPAKGGTMVMGAGAAPALELSRGFTPVPSRVPVSAPVSAPAPAPVRPAVEIEAAAPRTADPARQASLETRLQGLWASGLLAQGVVLVLVLSSAAALGVWLGLAESAPSRPEGQGSNPVQVP